MSSCKAQWGVEISKINVQAQLSQSDEQFMAKGFKFIYGPQEIGTEELNDLFAQADFPRREASKLVTALAHTYLTLSIRYCGTNTRLGYAGQLMGFARVTSDGALSATIWDVVVLPRCQRRGLGRALMERLVTHLAREGIHTVTLFAEASVVGMYKKLGFIVNPQGMQAMAFNVAKNRASIMEREPKGCKAAFRQQ